MNNYRSLSYSLIVGILMIAAAWGSGMTTDANRAPAATQSERAELEATPAEEPIDKYEMKSTKAIEREGFLLTITPIYPKDSPRQRYSLEDAAMLRVTLKNVSEATRQVEQGREQIRLIARNEEGEIVDELRYGKMLEKLRKSPERAVSLITLKPGQEFSTEVTINRRIDLTLGGKFEVTASRMVPELQGEKGTTPTWIDSNTIVVEIYPR